MLWAAGEVYGRSSDFRATLRLPGLAYVVIIPCDYKITVAKNTVIRADEAISDAVFEQRSAGNGAKGPRHAQWAMLATADPRELLFIRRLPDRGKNQCTFCLCYAPEGRPATTTYFITIAGRRQPVETTFKTAKDALGWDQSQARTWDAICRHTALTALAQIRTIAIRSGFAGAATPPEAAPDSRDTPREMEEPAADPADLQFRTGDAPLPATAGQPCPHDIPAIRLSDAETGRITRIARDWKDGRIIAARAAFELRWSAWRRRHQARARWHHYAARLTA